MDISVNILQASRSIFISSSAHVLAQTPLKRGPLGPGSKSAIKKEKKGKKNTKRIDRN
jgi:hypothetical protein